MKLNKDTLIGILIGSKLSINLADDDDFLIVKMATMISHIRQLKFNHLSRKDRMDAINIAEKEIETIIENIKQEIKKKDKYTSESGH